MTDLACSSCKQILIFIPDCPCRNYKVWPIDGDEGQAKTIKHARSFNDAAEDYIENYVSPDNEKTYEVMAKNYYGLKKKVLVYAEIRIELTSQTEEIEEEISA